MSDTFRDIMNRIDSHPDPTSHHAAVYSTLKRVWPSRQSTIGIGEDLVTEALSMRILLQTERPLAAKLLDADNLLEVCVAFLFNPDA